MMRPNAELCINTNIKLTEVRKHCFNYNSDNYIDQLTILFAKNLEDKYVNLRKIVIQWHKITPYLKISKKYWKYGNNRLQ